jgi:haloacid dehalogenase-like hydrolase
MTQVLQAEFVSDRRIRRRGILAGAGGLALGAVVAGETGSAMVRAQADPLPSWNEGAAKQAILDFVAEVTDRASEQFVPEADRIATFDNDGTLWVEQPLYTQLVFAFDQIKAMAPDHPEWQSQQPYAAILADDQEAMSAFSEHDVAAIVAATHAGMTTDAFAQTVRDWLSTAKHPRFDRLFTDLAYQPQLELLNYLRANGFRPFIVSGGGIDLMRTFTEAVYGIPPNQVIGSSGQVTFSLVDGVATLTKEAKIGSIDDKEGKPVNIHLHIGKKPILAVGNADGDQPMLEYTDQGSGPRLMLLVHHDDAEREYAYDRESHIGKLDTAWDKALEQGWIVVSMKDDWNKVFS